MANPKETGDKAEEIKKTTAPEENPAGTAETSENQSEITSEQGSDTASDGDKAEKTDDKPSETKKNDAKSAKPAKTDEKKAGEPSVYFVKGYGNIIGAKSQADAEKRAAKILEDRRK